MLLVVTGGVLVLAASVPLSLLFSQSLRDAEDLNLQEIGFSETIDDSSHQSVLEGYDYLATGSAKAKAAWASALIRSDRALRELKVSRAYLTFPGPEEKAIVRKIESTRMSAIAGMKKAFREKAATGRVSEASYASYRRETDTWLRWTDKLSEHEVAESEERRLTLVASTATLGDLTFGLGLLALLISAVAGYVISSQMLRPIRRLSASASAVADGDLSVEVGTSRRDELGDLERAFDRMRQSLAHGAIERLIAQTLQEALLTLPAEVPGLRFAHAYNSATEMARVGGDFYDLFELSGDRVGFTVGDVSGKGVEASALTSLIKNTVRAVAGEEGKTPADVLALTNSVLFQASDSETFATVFFAVLDRDAGGLVYCSGGHTAAGVLHSDGTVGRLPANSPLVGAYSQMVFVDSEGRLGEGDILFLYTDGLIEARQDGGALFGEDRLFDLLEALVHEEPQALVDRVFDVVLGYAGGKMGDDVAILAVQWQGVPPGQPTQMKLDVALPEQRDSDESKPVALWSGT